ncbi:tol-pal system YbgF family protein [Bacteriovorax sp. Seq25_V]|uniref:tetratricopeptide repeat protein n=1 Tax=Bacteriovorax sp. Seq25_V TaxID=1201288 RepID=UPI00038A48A9|nr:lipoprotein [Bacteriovorax sp. Seq25_V]EQC46619.1 putative lipoprotein [Bacteriovorax sp. Seq25_V]
MNFFRKKISFLTLIAISASLSSCSWMSTRKALFDEEVENTNPKVENSNQSTNSVPKAQYDQLLSKYESLLDKIKTAENQAADQIENSPSAKEGEMMEKLSKITPQADLAETVDVFGKNGISSQIPADIMEAAATTAAPSGKKLSDSEIQTQLQSLQKANKFVMENKMDSALILLKDLEESSNPQIRVRAKFYLAEMLFRQNEYDLSMQIYEEIIRGYAFSGLVIKSLGRLIVCTEKLKMDKKKERYYSILHDFFEAT